MSLKFLKSKNPAARLYSLSSADNNGWLTDFENSDQVVINFPNLPDEIALDRDSEWSVKANQLMPDGFHVYQHTNPLQIPFTFKLHAFDDYAVNGPETILQIAAGLHALTLPILTGRRTSLGNRTTTSSSLQNGTSVSQEQNHETSTDDPVDSVSRDRSQQIYFPPACVLDIMVGSGGPSGLGIHAVGYVRSVSVVLKGPWLSSGNDSVNRNLPSAAEFKFVFVHVPGYSNDVNALNAMQSVPQLGAKFAKNSLYNSVSLTKDDSGQIDPRLIKGSDSPALYKGL